MRKLLASTLLMVSALASAAETDNLSLIRPLLGSWSGPASGQPGSGTATRTYSLVLAGKFVHERNQTTYPPQERNPKGEVHEHWSLMGYDGTRKIVTFRQFHQEGFVATYVLNTAATTPTKVVFDSEQLENIGPTWRARETYEFVSPTEFVETFELGQVGKPLEIYSQTRFKRTSP